MLEKILCAACYYNNGKKYKGQPINIDQGIVTLGHRHGEAIETMILLFPKMTWYKNYENGFLTSRNRFVNRKEAREIAFKAGQVDKMADSLISEELY